MKIFLIDDSVMMRRLIKRALAKVEGIDIQVLEASDGMQALSMIREHGPFIDLILCDVNMPMVSGLSLLKIFQAWPEVRGVPFVMVTADMSGEGAQQAIQAGAVAVLGKPFRPEAILEIVKNPDLCGRVQANALQPDSAPE